MASDVTHATSSSDEEFASGSGLHKNDDDGSSGRSSSGSSSEGEGSLDEGKAESVAAKKSKRRRAERTREDEDDVDAEELRALQDDLGQDVREGKRARRRAEQSHGGASEEDASKSATAGPSSQSDEVWKAMQSQNSSLSNTEQPQKDDEPMVRVVKTYRFAGEEVKEEKMLPASHPDAKAFLAKQKQQSVDAPAPVAASTVPATSHSSSAAPPSRLAPAGPRRKKAGGGLAAMSAAATAKPSKLNTLEKSKMDWTAYKDTTLDDNQRHELDAQTKGGSSGLGTMKGYMERRNFLERVQDRLEGGSSGQGSKPS